MGTLRTDLGVARGPGGLSYDDALRRVMSLPDFERSNHSPTHSVFHLERMRLLMEQLGNPHLGIPTVHIAGSKGKGSTAAMVASVLTAQGYRTGLYTSPHLHSAVERIRVGLEPIERDEFADLVGRVWPAAELVGSQSEFGFVTFFELLTAMAFLYFSQIGADCQVVEVGLGGRLDATNIVEPTVCTISSISLDHVSVLGDTIALIAAEKAGIVKRGVPVVVAPQPQEAMEVLLEVAADRKAPLVRVDTELRWSNTSGDLDGQSFDVDGLRGRYRVRTPLLGDHQIENAATAIATLETLDAQGLEVSKGSVEEGLAQVSWPARLQVLSRKPTQLVVDGAHNPYSMRRMVEAAKKYFKFRSLILVFGASSGHSARGMMAEVACLSPTVIAVRTRHPRSVPAEVIAEAATEQGLRVAFESQHVGQAVERAMSMAGPEDLVVGTGSLFVAAEVIEQVSGMSPELYPEIKRPASPAAAP